MLQAGKPFVSVQVVFEEILFEQTIVALDKLQATSASMINGIVVSGGCALSIKANSMLTEKLDLPIYASALPEDGGLSVGAIIAVHTAYSAIFRNPVASLGTIVWDHAALPRFVRAYQPRCVPRSRLAVLAVLLVEGALLALVRGKQEVGPRALGRRSFVAFPQAFSNRTRDILNTVKRRQWFRPVAPIVRLQDATRYFKVAGQLQSPWMSFSPRLQEDIVAMFPSIAHLDGTARVQTVDRAHDSWLFDLLTAVQRVSGFGLLVNTSFNTHGHPLINQVTRMHTKHPKHTKHAHSQNACTHTKQTEQISVALAKLKAIALLDFLLVEDYLFSPINVGRQPR